MARANNCLSRNCAEGPYLTDRTGVQEFARRGLSPFEDLLSVSRGSIDYHENLDLISLVGASFEARVGNFTESGNFDWWKLMV